MNPRRKHAAAEAFAQTLVTAAHNRELHPSGSRLVRECMHELVQALQFATQCGVPMPLTLTFTADSIDYAGSTLLAPSLQAGTLLRACRDRGVAGLAFEELLTVEQADRLFDLLLLRNNQDCFAPAHRDRVLAACGLHSVQVQMRDTALAAAQRSPERGAMHCYQAVADYLHGQNARALHGRELQGAAAGHAFTERLAVFDEPSLLLSLAARDNVDRFTVGHSVRVALLALQVARAVGANRDQLMRVGTAALLHDIGKARVPQAILFKRGMLDADEWAQMQQHPRLGAELLLEQQEQVDPYTISASFCHHLWPEGLGYPHTRARIRPSGVSNLVRICDVFEALTAVRPYKQSLTPIEAYAVMFRTEREFHPGWLRTFVRTLGLFPVGSRVELDDGSLALVTNQTDLAHAPVVQRLTGPAGADLPAGAPRELHVGVPTAGETRTVQRLELPERTLDVPSFAAGLAPATAPTVAGACLGGCSDPGHRH